MITFQGRHFPKDLILMAVRWKVAHPLSYPAIEELMEERGVKLDHSTVQKWGVHYAPQFLPNIYSMGFKSIKINLIVKNLHRTVDS